MKILVIEKSEVCRFILEQCLTALGHVFHHVGRADDALQFIQSHEIDFVFIDMDFGRESATDAIKSIRSLQKNDWWPIAALSSETDEDAYADAILAGVDAVLPKPLSRKRILMQMIALERIYIARQSLQTKNELNAANLELLKLSMYDEVTGLANRRYFEETLTKEMKSAKRERRDLTLLMCEFGNMILPHETDEDESKNRQLNEIAAAIECIPSRPTDFVCRYGDNSFAVILPNTDEESALYIAERIQRSVESVFANTAIDWPTTPPTFHIGSATHKGQFQTMDDFIHTASTDFSIGSLDTSLNFIPEESSS